MDAEAVDVVPDVLSGDGQRIQGVRSSHLFIGYLAFKMPDKNGSCRIVL